MVVGAPRNKDGERKEDESEVLKSVRLIIQPTPDDIYCIGNDTPDVRQQTGLQYRPIRIRIRASISLPESTLTL
jgi:hypothetical protein